MIVQYARMRRNGFVVDIMPWINLPVLKAPVAGLIHEPGTLSVLSILRGYRKDIPLLEVIGGD